MSVKKNDREKAKEIYLEHDGKIPLVDIAEQIGRPPGTVRGWKSKDNWDDYLSGTLQDKMERSKTTEQSKTKKKKQKKNGKHKKKSQGKEKAIYHNHKKIKIVFKKFKAKRKNLKAGISRVKKRDKSKRIQKSLSHERKNFSIEGG